jgi:predicted nucleic acid-binding protein
VIVLDASAAVELLLGTAVGDRVGHAIQPEALLAPELLDVEVVSALARLVRAGVLSAAGGQARVDALRRLPVRRIPHRPLIARAWDLRDRVRVADGYYIACAEWARASLMTTDARLGRAALPGLTVTVVA